MLLPGCNRCGQCGCVCGKLPYTLTVEFSGLVNRTHSTYCPLTILSNFGCGAAAVATSPGGCDDSEPDCGESNRGPLAGVLLLDGGHDYARLGRREPVLTVSGGSGSGATFTPTLEPVDDTLAESCRNYRLASVAVAGGTNYVEGDALTITTDGVTVMPAVAIIHVGRSQPTVTASVAGGSGASLAVSLNSTGSGNSQEWHVASVAVNNGGSGYTFSGDPPIYTATLPVTFATTDTTVTAATGTARPVVTEPPLNAAWTNGAGTGFAATLTLTSTTDSGLPCYTVSGIAITAAGSGYTVGDTIEFTAENYGSSDSGVVNYTVTTVDGSGGVTGVSAANVLEFFARPTGAIASVTVVEDGAYYATDTTPSGVEVTEQGVYYTEDPTAPVCLAEVTVSADACGGSGAEITATIGDDPEDGETFGRITSLTIDDGGDGYLVWHWMCTRQSEMNDVPIVLTAVEPQKLVMLHVESCHGSGACIRVVPVGDGTMCDPPTPVLYDGQSGPIREVEVVSQGSGYASYGREVPQWVASAHGYSFTPAFGDVFEDGCGRSLWAVESFFIANVNGNPAYLDGWALSWIVTNPEHSDAPFSAVVRTRQSPTVTATADGPGAGATLAVTLEEVSGQPREWRVASVAVTNGGSGYLANTPVTFSVPARPGFYGHYTGQAATAVATANDGGEIIGVSVTSGGRYWLDNGVPQSVDILSGGKYYRENPALTPYVASPTVVITQLPPSDGSGAVIGVTVGSDPSNAAEFGKILTATISNGGSGYTLLGGPTECLYRGDYEPCVNDPRIEYRLRGNGKPPRVVVNDIVGEYVNTTVLECADVLEDCDDLPASASLLYGAPAGVTATITRGGTVTTDCEQPAWCGECVCTADFILPETQVAVTSDVPCAEGGTAAYSGDYQNLDLACGYRDEAGGTIVYANDIEIGIECCASPECNQNGPCKLRVRVCASGYVYDDVTDTWCPASGCSECLDWDVVDGEAVGAATFDIVQECPSNRTTTYSMTVSVGGA